jgi:hypothetical protein
MLTRRSLLAGTVGVPILASAGRVTAATPRDLIVMAKQID